MATGGLPPVMALTAADDVVFFAIMYPQILPRFLETSLEVFSRIAELLTGAGGKRYLADWHGTMTEQGWRRHRETRHDRRLKCKQTFDPNRASARCSCHNRQARIPLTPSTGGMQPAAYGCARAPLVLAHFQHGYTKLNFAEITSLPGLLSQLGTLHPEHPATGLSGKEARPS
jgi:hypothetical protein